MNTDLLKKIEQPFLKSAPDFEVGDTVSLNTVVREGNKKRIQVFKGVVIAIRGSGLRKMFTVRKIAVGGIGVEKIFPVHSPNVEKIEVVRKGNVRRSKLYYLRSRVGKRALKVREGELIVPEEVIEENAPAEAEKPAEAEAKPE